MKTQTTEYNSWKHMKRRCYNTKSANYHNYGGRGITVCERWRDSFENFYADMGPKPQGKKFSFSLERINNNGNYEPSNCKWATISEQNKNKRRPVTKNSTNLPGIYKIKGKYKVVKTFNTLEEAKEALSKI